MEKTEACLRCGSKQLIRGSLRGADGMATFAPDNIKFLSRRLFNYLWVEYDSVVCADCGLVVSTTDPAQARKITEAIAKQ